MPLRGRCAQCSQNIELYVTVRRDFLTLDNGWDYSPAEGRLEDIQLDCTLSEFLANPRKYLEDNRCLDCWINKKDWDSYQLQKGEDIQYTIRFWDPYYGEPFERLSFPIAEVKFLYTDYWEPKHYYDSDGKKSLTKRNDQKGGETK